MLSSKPASAMALLMAVLPGCTQDAGAPTTATTTLPAEVSRTLTSAPQSPSSPDLGIPDYGVQPTTSRVLAPAELTCPVPDGTTVDVTADAPGSPTAIVAVPTGFTASARAGVDRLSMTGPAGTTVQVQVMPTELDAHAAFQRYADERTGSAAINSVSVLPGDLCGYSGQELTGILAEQPGQGIEYADRVVHVWTNTGNFLIAVRAEAPNGTAGFDDTRAAALGDFGVRMPT